jgi:hypothetical protein
MAQHDPLDRAGGEGARAGEPPKIDWDQIEHAYIHGDWSLGRIADVYGSSPTTITARAKKHAWVRMVGTTPLPRGRRQRLPGTARAPRATVDQARRRKMIDRLLKVLDRKLTEIEARMEDAHIEGAPHSAADLERDARSLTSLARIYAKLVELDDEAKSGGQASDTSASARSDDADQLRRDLALRLERLNQAGNA